MNVSDKVFFVCSSPRTAVCTILVGCVICFLLVAETVKPWPTYSLQVEVEFSERIPLTHARASSKIGLCTTEKERLLCTLSYFLVTME